MRMLSRTPRLLLVAGKGGAGKTTAALATAVASAEAGRRVLVASLDPAHALCALLGQPGAPEPAPVPGLPRLHAVEVDALTELHRQGEALGPYLDQLLAWLGAPGVPREELARLPGLEELLVLARLAELAASEAYDLAVLDLAPTATTLRQLAAPRVMSSPLGRLARWQRSVLALLRPVLSRITDAPLPEDAFFQALVALTDHLGRLPTLLAGAATARLVATPEALALEQARQARGALARFGVSADALILNRLPEAEPRAGALERAARAFPDLPRLALRLQPGEVAGLAALREVGRELYGGRDPLLLA